MLFELFYEDRSCIFTTIQL